MYMAASTPAALIISASPVLSTCPGRASSFIGLFERYGLFVRLFVGGPHGMADAGSTQGYEARRQEEVKARSCCTAGGCIGPQPCLFFRPPPPHPPRAARLRHLRSQPAPLETPPKYHLSPGTAAACTAPAHLAHPLAPAVSQRWRLVLCGVRAVPAQHFEAAGPACQCSYCTRADPRRAYPCPTHPHMLSTHAQLVHTTHTQTQTSL